VLANEFGGARETGPEPAPPLGLDGITV